MNAVEPAPLAPAEPAASPAPGAGQASFPSPAPAQALERLRQRTEVHPHDARAWFDLGCALSHVQRPADALQALDIALTLAPYQPQAMCERGHALVAMHSLDEAADAFEEVLASQPLNGDALFSLGSVRYRQRRLDEAAALWRQAATVLEDPADALENLAVTLQHLRRPEEERAVWSEVVALHPCHPVAIHKLAALGVGPVPPRASDAYLTRLFDAFAPEFDSVLNGLECRIPELLTDLAREVAGDARAAFTVLDAGCGTGLSGERIRPWAKRLVGVDLSAEMLEQAQARGIYDQLIRSELTTCPAVRSGAFDLAVAGDVLNYFGALDEVLSALVAALRPEGFLLFTLEKASPEAGAGGFRLEPHGRYTHDEDYARQSLRRAGALVVQVRQATLRFEMRQPVIGLVIGAQRRSSAWV